MCLKVTFAMTKYIMREAVLKGQCIMKELRKNLIWIAVGAVVFWVEIILLSVSSNYELFKETVVLFVVPTVLFWAINRYGKETPFYFLKSVVCLWIGRAVFDVILFYVGGREVTRIMVTWQVMLTILMFCMKIIQIVYDKIPDKKAYFGYILIGVALAFHVSYIVTSAMKYGRLLGYIDILLDDMYELEHGIAFLIVVAVTCYQYQKRYKMKIKNNEITKKAYLCNAIKMTVVPFLLLVYPLYVLFLSE